MLKVEPHGRLRFLSEKEMRHLLQACRGTVYHDIFYTFLRTGMRKGELTHLRWDDVDVDRGLKAFPIHNRPLFHFHCFTREARPAATFKLTGQPAAVHLRGVLIIQLRGRAPSGEDAEKLFSCRLPEATRARRFGESDLLTVGELAAYLRVAPGTLRNWVSDGKVPYVKVGNQVRFLFKKVLE